MLNGEKKMGSSRRFWHARTGLSRIPQPYPRKETGVDHLLDEPESFTDLASLLRKVGKEKSLSKGRQLHNYISSKGFDGNTFLGNCLLQMYGACGSLVDAQAIFDKIHYPNVYTWNILIKVYAQSGMLENARTVFVKMPYRDVVSWNAVIAALAQSGRGKEALDLFVDMKVQGVKPNKISFVCALDACASLAALHEGQHIHMAIVHEGCEQDCVVGTALVTMYGKCGSLHNARAVFARIPHRSVVSWTAMVGLLAQNGHGKEALDMFYQMQHQDIKPNKISFICGVDACTSITALEEGRKIHAAIVSSRYEQDVVVGTGLVNMYGKCGCLHSASSVFGKMQHRNVLSWNAMITALLENGHCQKALASFRQLQLEGIKPDNITFLCALDACSSLEALEDGQYIHTAIVDIGYEEKLAVANALIDMYGKCSSLQDARAVFSSIRHLDVISWTSLIAAYTQDGNSKKALSLFHQMQIEGIKPDNINFVCVLDACSKLSALGDGQEIHVEVVGCSLEFSVVVGNALVTMYGKCGSLDNAKNVFDRMPHWDVISWTSMIAAFSQNGCAREALDIFQRMQLEGVKPNDVTAMCVLTACSHTGQVCDGWHFFVPMNEDHGIAHTRDHFVCMIDLLARAGHLDAAEDLINDMPFESVAVAWLCLLSACRIHGDLQRGMRAARHCFFLDPNNPAPYVMLSNIHA